MSGRKIFFTKKYLIVVDRKYFCTRNYFYHPKIFIYTRFPINSSIIGLVAALGETVNIGDNSGDSAKFEDDGHFEHRSLLCMPLR